MRCVVLYRMNPAGQLQAVTDSDGAVREFADKPAANAYCFVGDKGFPRMVRAGEAVCEILEIPKL